MAPEELQEQFLQAYMALQVRYYDTQELTREQYQAEVQRLWDAYDTAAVLEGMRQPRGFNIPIYWARVAGFMPAEEKPILVRRSFAGTEIQVECYATQTAATLFQQGKLVVGNIVIVAFVDEDLAKAIVLDKVWGV